MGQRHGILGFLTLFVAMLFMGTVSAVASDCVSGQYFDGAACVDCPAEYPKSEDGADSINQCYLEQRCEKGTCPTNSKSCTWKTSGVIIEHYGETVDKTCAMASLTCKSDYYKTDDLTCLACTDIPGTNGDYFMSGGRGDETSCYTLCAPMCTHEACPEHGTCEYVDKAAGTGGVYYPNPNKPENCTPIAPVCCEMHVTCDTGYSLYYPDPDTAICKPNTLIIHYSENTGVGNIPDQECAYDSSCVAATNAAISKEYWEFVEWNTAADGSGQKYAAGANITNIISSGTITLYAQWRQLNTNCQAGKYYDGNQLVDCPAGSYCPGIGVAPAGQPGCAVQCPGDGQSNVGATAQTECFIPCAAPANIAHGTVTVSHDKEYNDGMSDTYPTCTYVATCSSGYVAVNNNTATPKCVWENPDNCPVGFYCPDGAEEPIQCPRINDDDVSPRGTSSRGARNVTDCYYIFEPWDSFKNGAAAGKCNWTGDAARYSACTLERAFSCLPGYYQLSSQTVGCTGVQQGYYSDGIASGCGSENYSSAECVASLNQKACPDKDTDASVSSAEYATSITQCNKACVKTDAHGTVSVARERVYANASGVYDACSFTVSCESGYVATDNGTENAHCAPRNYTVALNKNGGRGGVADSISCVFDSGVCDLPSVTGLERDGYSVVAKWCTDATGAGTCYNAGTRVTSNISGNGADITLYAVWAPKIYAINLDSDTANVAAAPGVIYLKYATGWFADSAAQNPITNLSQLPAKSGYNFSGFVAPTGDIRIIGSDGALLKSDQALTFTTANTTISVRWAAGLTECAAGTYYSGAGAECLTCTANNYCLGGRFATDSGIAGLDVCPSGGTSEPGAQNATQCYKSGINYVAAHGTGTQTCYFNDDEMQYTQNCFERVVSACTAGYWLDSTVTNSDCSPVGDGYYSIGGDVARVSCPAEDGLTGKTGRDNATSKSDCWLENRVYDLDNGGILYGTGTQTCFYNISANKYNDRCLQSSIRITYCVAGYWFDEATNPYDCSPVGENNYSEMGEIVRHACPTPRVAEAGIPNTRGNTTSGSATECFLTRELTSAQNGRGRWGCFYNDAAAVRDYTNCSNPEMYECDAGYYYNPALLDGDCIAVGKNNYSPALDINRYACPNGGYTSNNTAGAVTECLMDNVACTSANGTGTQTCKYNGTDAYNNCSCSDGCSVCHITACSVGYSLVNNSCIQCPANNVCSDGGQQTCSELTGGMYDKSDAGTTDVTKCWRTCALIDGAVAMSGRDYYGGTNTCKISQCRKGYSLRNGTCQACPAGYYCDGTGGDDDNKTACSALGNGKWNKSESGSTLATDCYKKCEAYAVVNGRAIPVSDKAYYPQECEYRGISDMGNECEIVNGVCIETACQNTYEMIAGRCRPCNRPNALSYAAEGNCVIASCIIGYHVENGVCTEDVRNCSAPLAATATQTWDTKQNTWGTCVISECNDGYHVASNACVSDVQDCAVEHGIGKKEWNHRANRWNDCEVVSCDAGYTSDPALTNEKSKQCGQCRNKFSTLGQVAVSSWVRECEIATCLYQGEMYNLDSNECVPICSVDGYEDETGTMKWNQISKRCVRTCKHGYLPW